MRKEYLEALKNIKLGIRSGIFYSLNDRERFINDDNFKIIEEALQRLESIDNAKPSEALECLYEDAKIESCWVKEHCITYAEEHKHNDRIKPYYETIKQALLKAQEMEKLLKSGDLSDGYHTFNQLYYQRCVLFASLVRLNKDKSWKSFKHSDNKYCFDSNGEWFIVGIDTPIGSYTYHYEKKYWDLFECQELECGKEWDGHIEEDVTRLLSLPNEQEKVLKILKEKKVELMSLYLSSSVEQYNNQFVRDENKLTQEEFDLLKQYFEKNIQKCMFNS